MKEYQKIFTNQEGVVREAGRGERFTKQEGVVTEAGGTSGDLQEHTYCIDVTERKVT